MKAILFDLDGVLVHTDHMHYQAWAATARSLGIDFDETVNERLRGVSRAESLEILLERYPGPKPGQQAKERLLDEKNHYYRELLKTLTPESVPAEVREMLVCFRERGLKLAVASSSKNAEYILEKTGLTGYFDGVIDGNQITRSKPDPEVFLKAAQALGVKPGDCLVVEDARAGVDAAKAAGMKAAVMGSAAGYEYTDIKIGRVEELRSLYGGYDDRLR